MQSINDIYNIKYKTLPSIHNLKQNIKLFITDEFYKGIGVVLENDIVTFTLPFGLKHFKNSKKISELEMKNYSDLIKILKKKITHIIIKNGNIIAVLIDNGNFHPIKIEKYNKDKHTLPVLDFNYVLDIYNQNNELNNTLFINKYNNYTNNYNNIKNEIKALFSLQNDVIKKLKVIIYESLKQKDINKKRLDIRYIIDFIVNNITVNDTIKTKKNKNVCLKSNENNCKTNKLLNLTNK